MTVGFADWEGCADCDGAEVIVGPGEVERDAVGTRDKVGAGDAEGDEEGAGDKVGAWEMVGDEVGAVEMEGAGDIVGASVPEGAGDQVGSLQRSADVALVLLGAFVLLPFAPSFPVVGAFVLIAPFAPALLTEGAGDMEGEAVGEREGVPVGYPLGDTVGIIVGPFVGESVNVDPDDVGALVAEPLLFPDLPVVGALVDFTFADLTLEGQSVGAGVPLPFAPFPILQVHSKLSYTFSCDTQLSSYLMLS